MNVHLLGPPEEENSGQLAPNGRGTGAVVLSVVVPTFNETANVKGLLDALSACLSDVDWELILVEDDSPDGTWAAVKSIANVNPRVRCLRRVGRRGLAGACVEGVLSSSAPFVAIMDGDLQHDESVLNVMLHALQDGGADLAIGTRIDVAGNEGMSHARRRVSRLGRSMARSILGTHVNDPMSGFFVIRRSVVERLAPKLSIEGFKILADILLTSPTPLRIVEVPYVFRARTVGTSKFNAMIGLHYAGFVVHKLSGGLIPVRFVLFAAVGAFGLAVHLLVLRFALVSFGKLGFFPAQLIATYVAMSGNFLLNNKITFRDHRYRGRRAGTAFVAFCLVCSVGTIANANLASFVFASRPTWWAAGLAGALVSSVWNYAASQTFIWPRRP